MLPRFDGKPPDPEAIQKALRWGVGTLIVGFIFIFVVVPIAREAFRAYGLSF